MKLLVTGGAGFIGSNLVAYLLKLEDVSRVIVLDDLSTGYMKNIQEFVSDQKFEFVKGDIRDFDLVKSICERVDKIVHLAALGSVPRSIDAPLLTNSVNVEGTLTVFYAAVQAGIKHVIYAASSSTYGDSPVLPKKEDVIGKSLSPYAVTKLVNELYADVFFKTYGLNTTGLRFFNVFGPKQNPKGAYAAVIPLFVEAILNDNTIHINGDGETSRDFTFIDNVLDIIHRVVFDDDKSYNEVFNVACGDSTSLNDLVRLLSSIEQVSPEVVYRDERKGDVKHSHADISKANYKLGYSPVVDIKDGLIKTYTWYKKHQNEL